MFTKIAQVMHGPKRIAYPRLRRKCPRTLRWSRPVPWPSNHFGEYFTFAHRNQRRAMAYSQGRLAQSRK
jgi:hypothetical protein